MSDELVVTTDDGSYGRQGLVTEPLAELARAGRRIDRVLAIGPVPMMRAVAEATRPYGVPTIVVASTRSWSTAPGCAAAAGCRSAARASSPASTAPSSTPTRSTSTVLTQRNAMYREAERRSLERVPGRSGRRSAKGPSRLRPAEGGGGRLASPARWRWRDDPRAAVDQGARQDAAPADAGAGPGGSRADFDEVNLGYDPPSWRSPRRCAASSAPARSASTAARSASRSREFVALVADGDFLGAAAKMREDNVLPAICGRVCPQEDQCEGACVAGQEGRAARHRPPRALRRRLRAPESGRIGLPPSAPATGKRWRSSAAGPPA